jgi:hypothetical protein
VELIIFTFLFLVLGLLGSLWGADSRDGLDWKPQRLLPPR